MKPSILTTLVLAFLFGCAVMASDMGEKKTAPDASRLHAAYQYQIPLYLMTFGCLKDEFLAGRITAYEVQYTYNYFLMWVGGDLCLD
jgi:hypothetical protein